MKRTGFKKGEKNLMLLSSETLLGLQMTGTFPSAFSTYCFKTSISDTVHSFVSIVEYVYSIPGVKENKIALLSRNLCQDPLENYFGCQRQRGGTSDNPNAAEFGYNTQALRIINSFCRGPIRGNCRLPLGKENTSPEFDSAPLPKRHKHTQSK